MFSIPNRLTVEDDFGFWLSGFFDGDGTFAFGSTSLGRVRLYAEATIELRYDDGAVLEMIRGKLGCGSITPNKARRTTGKTYELKFRNNRDLAEIVVPLFDRYPLHTKKAWEFNIWRTLVHEKYISKGRRLSEETEAILVKLIVELKRRRHPDVRETAASNECCGLMEPTSPGFVSRDKV